MTARQLLRRRILVEPRPGFRVRLLVAARLLVVLLPFGVGWQCAQLAHFGYRPPARAESELLFGVPDAPALTGTGEGADRLPADLAAPLPVLDDGRAVQGVTTTGAPQHGHDTSIVR